MTPWQISYWDGCNLRCVVVSSDPWNLINAIQGTPAGMFIYNIIKIERLPS